MMLDQVNFWRRSRAEGMSDKATMVAWILYVRIVERYLRAKNEPPE
jgi:hypothetical protein